MTCKTRRRPKRKVKPTLLNLKSLQNTESKSAFVNLAKNHSQNYNVESQSHTDISMSITKIVHSVAKNTLPPLDNQNRCNEIWKNDHKFK